MSNIVEFVKQQEQLFCGAGQQTVTWAKESQFAIQYFQKTITLLKQHWQIQPAHRTLSSMLRRSASLKLASNQYLVLATAWFALISAIWDCSILQWSLVLSHGVKANLFMLTIPMSQTGLIAPTHKYNAFGDRVISVISLAFTAQLTPQQVII